MLRSQFRRCVAEDGAEGRQYSLLDKVKHSINKFFSHVKWGVPRQLRHTYVCMVLTSWLE
jgi:hypothetical protein